MKNILFIKPDLKLYFAAMPSIGIWLKIEYEQVKTKSDLADLFYKWIEIAETTENTTKEWCYTSAAYYIYSFISGRSYESILNIEG